MKISYIYFLLLYLILNSLRTDQKISFLKKDASSFKNKVSSFQPDQKGIKDKLNICDLNKLDYTWTNQTPYSKFFEDMQSIRTRLTVFEIKNLFKFLDNKSQGQFDNKRWTDFNYLFLSKFITCDSDTNCILDQDNLTNCFQNQDFKTIIQYLPGHLAAKDLIAEIIFSLDYDKKGGINLSQFIFLKKVITGFNQYHVLGALERDNFFSALKTTFVDFFIDELDALMAYKIALNLMDKGGSFKIFFDMYVEICRIINAYLGYGVSIGEGYITKDQILRNFENVVYPSKLTLNFLKKYFSIYDDGTSENASIKIDPSTSSIITSDQESSLRFEDYANLEFLANIFTNYTMNVDMNVTGFTNFMTNNKYINPSYMKYIESSNFEDFSSAKANPLTVSNSIREIDFMSGFSVSFLETENKIEEEYGKNKFQFNSISENKLHSLFELNLGENLENKSKKNREKLSNKQTSSIGKFFNILDFGNKKSMGFDELVIFLKYLKIFDILNQENNDPRGIISSEKVNYINQIVVNPKLTTKENTRLQTFDTFTCKYVDFLYFFDYMFAPHIFNMYFVTPYDTVVDEAHIVRTMKVLNLDVDLNSSKFKVKQGVNVGTGNYDYVPILQVGLEMKCLSNTIKFSNFNQQDSANNSRPNQSPANAILNGGGTDLYKKTF